MSVTLQDVADYAGVSMKTVSNVVRGYAHVRPETRAKVQLAIDELGYRPNVMGRRLATGRTGFLSLSVASITLPYFAELTQEVGKAARAKGYRILLELEEDTLEGDRAAIHSSESGVVDGMLFQPSRMDSSELAQIRTDFPVLVLGEGAVPLSLDSIMIDNVAAAEEVTRHLLGLGRRRIAFLGYPEESPTRTATLRLAGYQRALEAAGIIPDTAMVIGCVDNSAAAAAAALGAALDAGLEIDGIMGYHDMSAIGGLRALQERGYRVPEDIAITGWDNTPITAVTYPSITCIAPDIPALAERAVAMLLDRIGVGDSKKPFTGLGRHELAPHALVIRESAPAIQR